MHLKKTSIDIISYKSNIISMTKLTSPFFYIYWYISFWICGFTNIANNISRNKDKRVLQVFITRFGPYNINVCQPYGPAFHHI